MLSLKEYREPKTRMLEPRENAHLKASTGSSAPHLPRLSEASRFELDLNVDDVGHTLIVGPQGTGMTLLGVGTLHGLLAPLTRRDPDFLRILLDALHTPNRLEP